MMENNNQRVPIDELTPEERFERRLQEYHIQVDNTKTDAENLVDNYHALLEKYNGIVFSNITDCDLRLIKQGMRLPARKQLYYKHKCNKPVKEIMIEEIYKPSYMCRLCITTVNGEQYKVLSEHFAEMQKNK